jgi:protein-disulfide isomerase
MPTALEQLRSEKLRSKDPANALKEQAMTTYARSMRPLLTLPVTEGRDHIQGPATAKVTLVEYGDYQCPHCLQAYPIMLDLQEHMGERMRLVFRNFPITTIHPDAQNAAEAAEAAGAQGKFWEMHDYLFEHQSRLDDVALLSYAADLGLDVARFMADLETHAFAARVHEDFLSGVRSGVNGTPTFFINGLRHDGPWDLETLTAAILAEAEGR